MQDGISLSSPRLASWLTLTELLCLTPVGYREMLAKREMHFVAMDYFFVSNVGCHIQSFLQLGLCLFLSIPFCIFGLLLFRDYLFRNCSHCSHLFIIVSRQPCVFQLYISPVLCRIVYVLAFRLQQFFLVPCAPCSLPACSSPCSYSFCRRRLAACFLAPPSGLISPIRPLPILLLRLPSPVSLHRLLLYSSCQYISPALHHSTACCRARPV